MFPWSNKRDTNFPFFRLMKNFFLSVTGIFVQLEKESLAKLYSKRGWIMKFFNEKPFSVRGRNGRWRCEGEKMFPSFKATRISIIFLIKNGTPIQVPTQANKLQQVFPISPHPNLNQTQKKSFLPPIFPRTNNKMLLNICIQNSFTNCCKIFT